jgi:dihydrodipicolinate synthase/N-acetylneuraminate lyase
MGLMQPGIRLPLVELSEPSKEPVREALRAAGITI